MTTSPRVSRGQVWLTYLRFVDKPEVGKVRPVLILDADEGVAVAVAVKITSAAPRGEEYGDVPIPEWESAGLRVPSCVRTDYVFRVALDGLLRDAPLGRVGDDTLAEVLGRISGKR